MVNVDRRHLKYLKNIKKNINIYFRRALFCVLLPKIYISACCCYEWSPCKRLLTAKSYNNNNTTTTTNNNNTNNTTNNNMNTNNNTNFRQLSNDFNWGEAPISGAIPQWPSFSCLLMRLCKSLSSKDCSFELNNAFLWETLYRWPHKLQ